MKLTERYNDVISNEKDLVDLYKINSFPVSMSCTTDDFKNDIFADMNWQISKSSGAIQLNPLIPLEIVYKEEHGSGCVGNLWNEHHKAFAKFILEFSPKKVLEIGGLHGILSKFYHEYDDNVDWNIIEPNPNPVQGVKAKFIKGYFDENFKINKKIDTIIHSHVLEHAYDPQKFLSQISNFLLDGQYLLFSVPNIEIMIKKKYTNALNFEHTYYLTEAYTKYLLNRNNFHLVKTQYFKDDHSIFYAYVRDSNVEKISLPKGLFNYNKKVFHEYIDSFKELVTKINLQLKNKKKNSKRYLFGGHVFSQYLINFGLDTSKIECILDNDIRKHGKRLYGTNLKVYSPKIIKDISDPIIIVQAGAYNNEIKKDIYENINSKAIFI
jgi:2-polyprenyl-3-methyl-5-hydroxy-6-metoxy-1,4-benzoquinol methylase